MYVVILLCREPRVPWYAKLIAACCVGYVFSPVQLIPDYVPVVGFLDDAVVVSLGMALLVKLTPASVLAECRERATAALSEGMGKSVAARVAALVIAGIWLLLAVVCGVLLLRVVRH